MRRRRWMEWVLVALLAVSCRQVEPLPPDALRDLGDLGEFQQAFNDAAGDYRLLVLLSPT